LFTCEQAVAFAEAARSRSDGEEEKAVADFWADSKRWRKEYPNNEGVPDNTAVRWLYWWNTLPYERQRKQMPAMSDQHSGNTFGAAVNLARLYLMWPDLVPEQYGALAPLVGSKDYGDIPPEDQ
jgi:hypothetical protein